MNKMKTDFPIWLSVVVSISMLLFAGCTKELDVKTVQETALNNIRNFESVKANITADIDFDKYKIKIDNFKSDIIYSDDKTYTSEYYTKFQVNALDNEFEKYLVTKDNTSVLYVKQKDGWFSYIQSKKQKDDISILLALLLSSDSSSNWKSMGYVDFNKTKCYRITRTLDSAMSQTLLLGFKSILNDAESLDMVFPELTLDVYVDAKTLYPIRYIISGNGLDIKISLSDFNKVSKSDVAIPNEIINNSDVSGQTGLLSNTDDKPEQQEIQYGVSFNNVFLGFINKKNYTVNVDEQAHIIEANLDNTAIRAFLVKDSMIASAVKAGYDFDKSSLLEQNEWTEAGIKDVYVSDIKTSSIGEYSLDYYNTSYIEIDTGLLIQEYKYYVELTDNIYATIVIYQDNKSDNPLTDDGAFNILSDFIFTT